MCDKDKNKEENNLEKQDVEERTTAKRAGIAIFLLVILLFGGVMFVVYFFEVSLGKTAGTIALVVITMLVAVYLYRDEIKKKLKRK